MVSDKRCNSSLLIISGGEIGISGALPGHVTGSLSRAAQGLESGLGCSKLVVQLGEHGRQSGLTMLQTEPFAKSIASLERALHEYQREANEFVRDACIQRFEYTYDLSHKMLKRHLEMTAANPAEMDGYSFQQLIRTGAEKGLLANSWDHWSQYRLVRNITSHSYNEARTLEVFAQIPAFLIEAQYLLNQLNTNQPYA